MRYVERGREATTSSTIIELDHIRSLPRQHQQHQHQHVQLSIMGHYLVQWAFDCLAAASRSFPPPAPPIHLAVDAGQLSKVRQHVDENASCINTCWNGRTPLCAAYENGSFEIFDYLVHHPAIEIDAVDDGNDRTLLWRAVEQERPDRPLDAKRKSMLEMLLHRKANVHHCPSNQRTARAAAGRTGASTSTSTSEDVSSMQVLHVASSVTVARLLLEYKANAQARTLDGRSVLHTAAGNRFASADLIRFYCTLPHLDVWLEDSKGRIPLHYATSNPDLVTALLDIASNRSSSSHSMTISASTPVATMVNKRDHNGATPLHLVAAGGNETVVELLLKAHAQPLFATESTGDLAIHIAARHAQVATLSLLYSSRGGQPISPLVLNRLGNSLFHEAIMSNNLACLQLVCKLHLEHGHRRPTSMPNVAAAPQPFAYATHSLALNARGTTPLHHEREAALFPQQCRVLVSHALAHEREEFARHQPLQVLAGTKGESPLHYAAALLDSDLITFLRSAGCPASIASSSTGFTPLHIVLSDKIPSDKHLRCVQALLSSSSDTEDSMMASVAACAKANSGLSPLHLCVAIESVHATSMLKTILAAIKPSDDRPLEYIEIESGDTVLHRVRSAEHLLTLGASGVISAEHIAACLRRSNAAGETPLVSMLHALQTAAQPYSWDGNATMQSAADAAVVYLAAALQATDGNVGWLEAAQEPLFELLLEMNATSAIKLMAERLGKTATKLLVNSSRFGPNHDCNLLQYLEREERPLWENELLLFALANGFDIHVVTVRDAGRLGRRVAQANSPTRPPSGLAHSRASVSRVDGDSGALADGSTGQVRSDRQSDLSQARADDALVLIPH